MVLKDNLQIQLVFDVIACTLNAMAGIQHFSLRQLENSGPEWKEGRLESADMGKAVLHREFELAEGSRSGDSQQWAGKMQACYLDMYCALYWCLYLWKRRRVGRVTTTKIRGWSFLWLCAA